MSSAAETIGIIRTLEKLPREDVHRWLIAAMCVQSVQESRHPREVLDDLAEAVGDTWEEIRTAIILSQFEDQMGAESTAPIM